MNQSITLTDLQDALTATDGRTPLEILDAFCPVGTTIAGKPLVALSAGHDLFLARIKHPLAFAGKNWTANDVATALFVFTTPSSKLFAMMEQGTYESEFFSFLDGVAIGELEGAATAILAHWTRCRSTTVAMKAPAGAGDSAKKKAGSVGGSRS